MNVVFSKKKFIIERTVLVLKNAAEVDFIVKTSFKYTSIYSKYLFIILYSIGCL